MVMSKSTRLVILASIISSSAAECVIPHPSFGLSLAIYSHTFCKSQKDTDYHIFREHDLAEGCTCVPFPRKVSTVSYVFSTGEHKEATIELWTGKDCDRFLYHNIYLNAALEFPGENEVEPHVDYRVKLHSARICFKRDHKRPGNTPHHPNNNPGVFGEVAKVAKGGLKLVKGAGKEALKGVEGLGAEWKGVGAGVGDALGVGLEVGGTAAEIAGFALAA
ncbi:hypothetical protein BJ138DRAFT_1101563 [Hygrophoropsis aurantiaca]|uniref:Uncharacterized protein n=1 Tax=Hygrophoropsis aurantiaca TaxID=72124 RepID=A0ACB8ABE3_9AGAM|nr:hypothetical protein BJ138DRAFT_1101563 [Hygrophoropsis aurantiaca]